VLSLHREGSARSIKRGDVLFYSLARTKDVPGLGFRSAFGEFSLFVMTASVPFWFRHLSHRLGLSHESGPSTRLEPLEDNFPGATSKRFLSFAVLNYEDPDVAIRVITMPHWFVALLLAIRPTTRLVSVIRQRRRIRTGHCPTCGYDLRATPERCPECGKPA
jgi:hypothetical protein